MNAHPDSWIVALSAALSILVGAPSIARADGCVDCHGNPELRVTNPKLFTYFEDWRKSVHHAEQVVCVDCHGGDSTATEAALAHSEPGSAPFNSAVDFDRIPQTCGRCHSEIARRYLDSVHYQMLLDGEAMERGPNCVTCHGPLRPAAIGVAQVAEICGQCHNETTENHPELPARAEETLGKMASIDRCFRTICTKVSDDQQLDVRKRLVPRVEALAHEFHRFDLDHVSAAADSLLADLCQERIRIRRGWIAEKRRCDETNF